MGRSLFSSRSTSLGASPVFSASLLCHAGIVAQNASRTLPGHGTGRARTPVIAAISASTWQSSRRLCRPSSCSAFSFASMRADSSSSWLRSPASRSPRSRPSASRAVTAKPMATQAIIARPIGEMSHIALRMSSTVSIVVRLLDVTVLVWTQGRSRPCAEDSTGVTAC